MNPFIGKTHKKLVINNVLKLLSTLYVLYVIYVLEGISHNNWHNKAVMVTKFTLQIPFKNMCWQNGPCIAGQHEEHLQHRLVPLLQLGLHQGGGHSSVCTHCAVLHKPPLF